MKMVRFAIHGSLVVLLIWAVAAADIPGRWEKMDVLAEGTEIIVQLKSGARLETLFLGSSAETITIRSGTGGDLAIRKQDVAQIVKLGQRSKKPVWLGAAIGGGGGMATGVAISASFDETFLARADLMALTLGAAGAAIGALIGHAVADPEQEILYTAS